MTINDMAGVIPPPKSLKGFPKAERVRPKTRIPGGGLRARWKDADGTIYEWDYQHGAVEVFNRNGSHRGECDPDTGESVKEAVPDRRIEP